MSDTGDTYFYFVCQCGHGHISYASQWPARLLADFGVGLKPDVLAKMRCSACGRVGRPKTTISGWSNSQEARDGVERAKAGLRPLTVPKGHR